MGIEYHDVDICPASGHVLISAFAVRCVHTEAWWFDVRTFRESGEQDLQYLYRTLYELGPFDDRDALERSFSEACRAAMSAARQHDPDS